MNKKILIGIIVIVILGLLVFFIFNKEEKSLEDLEPTPVSEESTEEDIETSEKQIEEPVEEVPEETTDSTSGEVIEYQDNLGIESGAGGEDGKSTEEVAQEIEDAPVSDPDFDPSIYPDNNTFNGVQYGSRQEYWEAVGEYAAEHNPDIITAEEFDEWAENFFVDPSELPKE